MAPSSAASTRSYSNPPLQKATRAPTGCAAARRPPERLPRQVGSIRIERAIRTDEGKCPAVGRDIGGMMLIHYRLENRLRLPAYSADGPHLPAGTVVDAGTVGCPEGRR